MAIVFMEQSHSSAMFCETYPRLDEVLTRYRRSVHQLFPPASTDIISKSALRLGIDIPQELWISILSQWREFIPRTVKHSTSRVIVVCKYANSSCRLFAEGPRKEEVWAFVQTEREDIVYGLWSNDVFVAMHDRFFSVA